MSLASVPWRLGRFVPETEDSCRWSFSQALSLSKSRPSLRSQGLSHLSLSWATTYSTTAFSTSVGSLLACCYHSVLTAGTTDRVSVRFVGQHKLCDPVRLSLWESSLRKSLGPRLRSYLKSKYCKDKSTLTETCKTPSQRLCRSPSRRRKCCSSCLSMPKLKVDETYLCSSCWRLSQKVSLMEVKEISRSKEQSSISNGSSSAAR